MNKTKPWAVFAAGEAIWLAVQVRCWLSSGPSLEIGAVIEQVGGEGDAGVPPSMRCQKVWPIRPASMKH